MYVYILRLGTLTNPKFFVGKTKKLAEIKGEFEEVIINGEGVDLDVIVLRYMELYGVDNVRGGSFSDPKLCNFTKRVIKKLILDKKGICYRCRGYGHSAFDCGRLIIYRREVPKILPQDSF